jgi:hypothetical protein
MTAIYPTPDEFEPPPWGDTPVIGARPNGHAPRDTPKRVLSWANLMQESAAPPPMLRPGLPKVGCAVLAGSPKVGKSLWATQTAFELGCRVLLIAEEGSRAGIAWRLRKQATELSIQDPPLSLAHLQRTRLDNPASVRSLRSLVDSVGAELVIVDPLNKAHGADENRPSQMTPVMDALSAIAYDLGIAVLALHHLAKPSAERRGDIWDRFRGASSIRSGTDANLILDGTGTSLRLVGEFRDAEPLSEYLTLDRDALIFRPTDGPRFVGKIDPQALAAYVRERGPVTVVMVMAAFGVARHTARVAIEALSGIDWHEGTRGQRTYFLEDGTGQ